jgi:DNA-binding CsgD family transcriptional regulator
MRKHLEDTPRERAVARYAENLRRLTPREREILEHMLHADTAKDTARQLKLALGTTKNLRSRVLEKLDARNSVDLLYINHEAATVAPAANDDAPGTRQAGNDA